VFVGSVGSFLNKTGFWICNF